jgi:hypothetical protein
MVRFNMIAKVIAVVKDVVDRVVAVAAAHPIIAAVVAVVTLLVFLH